VRISELGSPDYATVGPKVTDSEGNELSHKSQGLVYLLCSFFFFPLTLFLIMLFFSWAFFFSLFLLGQYFLFIFPLSLFLIMLFFSLALTFFLRHFFSLLSLFSWAFFILFYFF